MNKMKKTSTYIKEKNDCCAIDNDNEFFMYIYSKKVIYKEQSVEIILMCY